MQTEITKKSRTIYNIRFSSLTDLYDYLKSNPEVNEDVFQEQSSLKQTLFYGEPLENAIEYCISGYYKGLDDFLTANDTLNQTIKEISYNRTLSRALYGGVPLAPLVAAGVPDCMLNYQRDNTLSVRNLYFNISYSAYTTEEQIINRGLATIYIIQALEARGELINFKTFEMSRTDTEIVNIEIDLKKPGDLFLDVEKCYFPLVGKEFLRRIAFRVLESSPVTDMEWSDGYGSTVPIATIKSIFNTKPGDLIISNPDDMNISGYNIYDDTISLIKKLKLEDSFDIEKIKTLKKKL